MNNKKTKCLIISASNVQNVRIRKELYNFLLPKFDELFFVGDFLVKDSCKQIKWKKSYNRKGIFFEILIIIRLIIIFIKERPTHIISFAPKVNIYCGIITCFLKIKHIAIISGLGSMSAYITSSGSFYNRLLKYSLSKASSVITMNEHNNGFFKSFLKNNKVWKIPSEGLDTTYKALDVKSHENKKILYLSRIISEKGIFLIIDSFKRIKEIKPNAQLMIAGEMSLDEKNGEKSKFEKTINFNGINYYGEVSESKKIELLLESDIVILPSRYGEGLPMILLEGQLYGSLVVTTNVTGCKDAIPPFLKNSFCEFSEKSITKSLLSNLNMSEDKIKIIKSKSRDWVKKTHDFRILNKIYNNIFVNVNFYN